MDQVLEFNQGHDCPPQWAWYPWGQNGPGNETAQGMTAWSPCLPPAWKDLLCWECPEVVFHVVLHYWICAVHLNFIYFWLNLFLMNSILSSTSLSAPKVPLGNDPLSYVLWYCYALPIFWEHFIVNAVSNMDWKFMWKFQLIINININALSILERPVLYFLYYSMYFIIILSHVTRVIQRNKVFVFRMLVPNQTIFLTFFT
jgi:hypothetical protein